MQFSRLAILPFALLTLLTAGYCWLIWLAMGAFSAAMPVEVSQNLPLVSRLTMAPLLPVPFHALHWHVDWLLARVPVGKVIVELEVGECDLVRRDLESGRWAVAAPGFGSSDCRSCPAHLLAEIQRISGPGPRAAIR